ncbi:MAG: AAA family ATPase [Thermodesulfobacteriota bacterium]
MSQSHREAFDHLLFGIHQRRGFIEVVGGIGTGKTTLCRALLEELEGKVSTALIFNTFLSEIELLKAINDEFGIDSSGGSRKELIDVLNRFLIDQLARGGNACLILDECQNLQVPVLEQIRVLSNLETENEKLLQIVMVGQPEFHDLLKTPPLKPLDERIHVRSFLDSLTEEDTRGYISHRLTVAGSRGDIVFTEGALRAIYEYSQGIPRRINTVCDRCLIIAYSQETLRITKDHVHRALEEIQAGVPVPRRSLRGRRAVSWVKLQRPALAVAGIAVLSGAVFLGTVIAPKPSAPPRLGPAPAGQTPETPPGPRVEWAPASEGLARDEVDTQGVTETFPTPSEPEAAGPLHEEIRERLFLGLSELRAPVEGFRGDFVPDFMGMEARRFVVSWQDLMRFQRPCLLELFLEGDVNSTLVVLRGISDGFARIQDGEMRDRLVSREDLARSWFGGVWILMPAGLSRDSLKPRARGESVFRLQRQLARLGYLTEGASGLYDEPTRRAVMALQRDMHLPVDGIAGPHTRAMIMQLLGEEGRGS